MKPRFLTFDCYGTLVDWKKGIEASLGKALGPRAPRGRALLEAYVAAEKKQEESYQKYREVLRKSSLALADELGLELGPGAAKDFAASVPSWPVFSDTRSFLREAGAMGMKKYILSNVDTDLLEETIGRNDLEVDGYVTAEEVGSYKPRLGHWKRFFEKTGAKREETLHVAQSLFHDIVPTQKLGISSAWVNRYRERLPRSARPTYISDNLSHLLVMLRDEHR